MWLINNTRKALDKCSPNIMCYCVTFSEMCGRIWSKAHEVIEDGYFLVS